VLFEDAHWLLEQLGDVPGWAVLWLKRHADGIGDLTAEELALVGPTLARVSSALREATGGEKVYLQVYGEAAPHFHVAMLTRGTGVHASHRGPALLANASAYADPDATRTAAEAVRACLGAA
jgi:diadenosine tetraphosphate (Ap4A) HIT family hydrolase